MVIPSTPGLPLFPRTRFHALSRFSRSHTSSIRRSSSRAFGCWLRHQWFGPLAVGVRGFTPTFRGQKQLLVLDFLPLSTHELPVLLATPNRSGLRPSFPARPICCSAFRHWSASLALPTAWPTMPSADFCAAVRSPHGSLSSEIGTRRRPPQVSSIAFPAPLPDLQPWPLMDMDFAISCPLVRPRMPRYPISVRQVAVLLHTSFRRRLAMTPLRFANPSPPSGWIGDFHPQAIEHAGHIRRCSLTYPPTSISRFAADSGAKPRRPPDLGARQNH